MRNSFGEFNGFPPELLVGWSFIRTGISKEESEVALYCLLIRILEVLAFVYPTGSSQSVIKFWFGVHCSNKNMTIMSFKSMQNIDQCDSVGLILTRSISRSLNARGIYVFQYYKTALRKVRKCAK